MNGLHDLTGHEATVRLAGRECRLPPMRIRHWGTLEQHYLALQPDPIEAAVQLRTRLSKDETQAAVLRAFERATRLPYADVDEVFRWASTHGGMPYALSVLLRDEWPEATVDWCRRELGELPIEEFGVLRKALWGVANGAGPKSSGSSPAAPATPS